MCCLVSKSWVSRAREHLFYEIEFQYLAHVNACKRAFLDPTRSPAHHTRSLSVRFIESIFIADAEEGSWVKTFSNVVRLELRSNTKTWFNLKRYLALFYGFSPVVKSLRVFTMCPPPPQVFSLICSLPLLEDLAMVSTPAYLGDRDEIVPRLSPPLTGTLCIHRCWSTLCPDCWNYQMVSTFTSSGVWHAARRNLNGWRLWWRYVPVPLKPWTSIVAYSVSHPPLVLVVGSAPDLDFQLHQRMRCQLQSTSPGQQSSKWLYSDSTPVISNWSPLHSEPSRPNASTSGRF